MEASLPTTEAGAAPFLTKLAESSWLDFVEALEAYRGRGGRRELKQLISPAAQEVLRDQDIDAAKLGEDELLKQISQFFSPLSVVEAYDRFKKLKVRATDGVVIARSEERRVGKE